MNYVELHIGDYETATAHLTACEDGVYGRLIRRYYHTEAPLPRELAEVQRKVRARARDELRAVETVLSEFFFLADDGWHHKRCDEEIERYRERQDSKAGNKDNEAERKRRYRQRRAELFAALREHGVVPEFDTPTSELETELSRVSSQVCPAGQSRTGDADGTANQTPDTRHQTPEKEKGRSAPIEIPSSIPGDVWVEWHHFRNARKGWTPRARELSMRSLLKLQAQGFDPRAVVEQSIERGWTGLFPIHGATNANRTSSRGLSAVERVQQAIDERRSSDIIEGEIVERDP